MSFTSPIFFFVLAGAGFLFYQLPAQFRVSYLLLLSYIFYAINSWIYLILLITASAVVYFVGLKIADSKSEAVQTRFMAAGIISVVAVIVAFKVAGAWSGFWLPLGLSYYSFKLISYLIEVSWDCETVERDTALFFLYPAFFPQIVSGPIQRPGAFFSQMRAVINCSMDGSQVESGFTYIVGGLMLKLLIGDRLAVVLHTIDAAPNSFTHFTLLATIACYTLQLYADFAGYTYIALGIGKVFGIDGPPNFNAPFLATNILEMWRRWHMSLTSWLTDYLFTPLSMELRNFGQAGLIIAVLVNMVSVGIWHGFTISYLVFGLLHSGFSIATLLILRGSSSGARSNLKTGQTNFTYRGRMLKLVGAFAGMVVTFGLMSFSQIFFHSHTWSQAITILDQVLGITRSGSFGFSDIGPGIALSTAICAIATIYFGSGSPGSRRIIAGIDRVIPRYIQYGVCLFLLMMFSEPNNADFIYGQF